LGALCAVWLLGCTFSPDPSLWQRDATGDGLLVDAGDAVKPPTDGPPPGEQTPDAPIPDTTPPPQPVCTTPTIVGTTPPTGPRESALRADGLVLTTLSSGARYSTKRSATDQPFGAWATTTAHPSGGDPTFFSFQGTEFAVVARTTTSGGPRHLELCTLPNNCTKTLIRYASNDQEVTDDMDGPSVTILTTKALMAHNIGPGGANSGDIYLASTTNVSKGWTTRPVSTLAVAGYKEDDPSLSPDGLVIVFSGLTTTGDTDIWYASRVTLADSFGAPQQLTSANSGKNDRGTYLAEVTIKGKQVLELYFSSDRDGTTKVYRSTCSY